MSAPFARWPGANAIAAHTTGGAGTMPATHDLDSDAEAAMTWKRLALAVLVATLAISGCTTIVYERPDRHAAAGYYDSSGYWHSY
jgi:hypothetical protein